jgi:hypothetical protein
MKDTYEKSIPVNPSQRRELKEELEWLVFKKEKRPPVKETKQNK